MRVAGCALLLLIAVGSIYGCRDYPPLVAQTCGNAVIEGTEDCDSFPREPGTICRPAGAEGECRYDCTPPTMEGQVEGDCPPGYECNPYDTICHKPGGTFTAGPSVIAEGIQEIHLGDFDGDGRKDALTVSAAEQRVHFFDTLGGLVTRTDVPGALQRPGVGRLSGKGDLTDDFTNIAGIGLSVLRGQDNRSVAPTQYELIRIKDQSRYSLFTIDSEASRPGHEVMGLFQVEKNPDVTIRTLNPDGSASDPPDATISAIPGPLAGEAAVADLFSLPFQDCEEAVISFVRADHVVVLSPCATLPALKQQNVFLDGEGYITSAAHLADMNADGALDIVMGGFAKRLNASAMVENCHFVGIAYNTGGGTFASTPGAAMPDSKAALVFDYFNETGTSCAVADADIMGQHYLRPIAAGDVNGDGVGDYVDPYGIHIATAAQGSMTPSGFKPAIRLADSFWTSAVIADLTADTIPDVIAGSEFVPGIDFFQGTSNPEVPFNFAKIASEHPVANLKAGFFDADLVRDIVLSERKMLDPSAPPNSSGDELAVLFGRTIAPPEAPTRFGRMSRIQQVLTADFPDLTIPGNDLMTDVLVLTGQEFPRTIDKPDPMAPEAPQMAEEKSLLVLPGNGERQLLSSFRLIQPHVALPLRTAVGQFVGDATGPDDVAVFTLRDTGAPELWLLPVDENGLFAPFYNGMAPMNPATTATPVTIKAIADSAVTLDDRLMELAVANIDGAGPDEIVAFIPTNDVVAPELYRVVARTGSVKDPDGPGTFTGWTLESFEKLDGLFFPLHLETIDINNDTFEDVIGVFLEKPTKQASLPPAHVVVYLSTGSGGFTKVPVDPPRHIDNDPEFSFDDRPWTVSAVNIDVDPEKELVIFSMDRMYIAHFDKMAGEMGEFSAPKELMQVGGTVSAGGDITGDKIDDIAVSDGTNLVVLVGGSP